MKLLVALFSVAALAQIRFEDVTAKSGVRFSLDNAAAGRFHQVELMPGGVAAFDYNNDGCADLYFTNGAALPSLRKTLPKYSNRLYRGKCDGTFLDVTSAAGVGGEGYSMGLAAADYDNDGNRDLFVTGVNRNILYRNLGNGTFEDATAKARLGGVHPKLGKLWSISAAWLDYDNDGCLDLFVTNYVFWDPRTEGKCGPVENRLYCHPDNYKGTPNQLFRNNGDGTFSDVTEKSGIGMSIGKGMGVAVADFNADGRLDIFVANDSVRNFLFRNDGDGAFTEIGLEAGVALPDSGEAIAGMGADFRDVDNDGLPDIVMTGMINDSYLLFRNRGKELLFEDRTLQSGLARATRQLTGWGMGIYDFNNDGFKDLFFANSHFPQLGRFLGADSALSNTVLANAGKGTFSTVAAGLERKALWRGAAFADFDNDGRIDIALSALNESAQLLRNVSQGGEWIAFRLQGSTSNREAVGAKLTVRLSDGRVLTDHVTTSVGYASSSDATVHFGIGVVDVEQVEIVWPSGAKQLLTVPKSGAIHTVIEK